MNRVSKSVRTEPRLTYWERGTKHIAENSIRSKHASSNHKICVDHVIQERQLRNESPLMTRVADQEKSKHTKRNTIETPIGNPAIIGAQMLNEGKLVHPSQKIPMMKRGPPYRLIGRRVSGGGWNGAYFLHSFLYCGANQKTCYVGYRQSALGSLSAEMRNHVRE
jgi:hypothetical protein